MISQTAAVGKYFIIEWLGSIVRFPFWWETDGLTGVLRWMRREWKNRLRQAALGLWVRSFFVPMYGQYDWTGRLLSIMMRMVVLFARVSALALTSVWDVCLLAAWVMLPLLAAIFLFVNVLQAFAPV